ncbi:MAG: integration host factor subunit beta [Acidobacteriia bacterium]|nr:integration host factor subunit beta [Terriglobia bacterium]
MAKLTKADLSLEIARAVAVSHKEAKGLIAIILDSMVRALRKGERVEVRGFGNFSTHTRAPRRGRNPLTGAQVAVPAKRVPNFRPSRELRVES